MPPAPPHASLGIRLDLAKACLWRGARPIPLRPKTCAVLQYLLAHSGQLVTKATLLDTVWPETAVSDVVLMVCIRELRQALGDDSKAPRFIETVHRRGYRLVAGVTTEEKPAPTGTHLLVPSLEQEHKQVAVMQRHGMAPPHSDAVAWPAEAEVHTAGDQAPMCQVAGAVSASLLPVWEHRPVVVLALELTFPTAVVAPEGWQDDPWTVATRWQRLIEEKVQGFGGLVLQCAASFVLAVFGIPRALEQMPQRAVQAALAVRHLVQAAQAPSVAEPSPQLRMAVHLGTVLLEAQAGMPSAREMGVGETFALPVRLLGYARPGELLLSDEVGRQVEAEFALQARALPGMAASPDGGTYAVVGLRSSSPPVAPLQGKTLHRFVGRERELATLHALLTQVEHGQGQVMGIVGEPGMGKSHLLLEFYRSLQAQEKPVTYLEGHCLSYHSTVPYAPVLELLRQHCGITDTDGPEGITAKVTAVCYPGGCRPHAGGSRSYPP